MSLFLNLRGSGYGHVCDPFLLRGDPLVGPSPALSVVGWDDVEGQFVGRDVVLACHGFNVSYADGARSLGRLDTALGLASPAQFVGILWPGDWVIPALNYPFSVKAARMSGQKLGDFCNRWLKRSRSISLISHSLGARVILEAALRLDQPPKLVCLTAGAVNDDSFNAEYANLLGRDLTTQNLASRRDNVLRLAYPPGDLIAELLHDDHRFFQAAIGRAGPNPSCAAIGPFEIDDAEAYDHGNYLPPYAATPDPTDLKWKNVATFLKEAILGQRHAWPPA